MVRVKVCGITNIQDATAAHLYGADALGFVFAKSPRRVERETVRDIIRALPPFTQLVGVFVNEVPEVVAETVRYCRLNCVQLHGDEPPDYCAGFDWPVVKAFRVGTREDIERIRSYRGRVSALLLDTYQPGLAGGTGRTFDWSIAAEARDMGPLVLAGGLDPDNVRAAVQVVRPYAVDVSSGVEMSPGLKDHEKMRLFIGRAKAEQ